MKKGDIVKIRDGSWLQEITKNGLEHTNPQYRTPDMLWRVLQTGLVLPGEVFLGEKHTNDTIIQGVSSPERIVFTQECHIRAAYCECTKTVCPHCNREIKGE